MAVLSPSPTSATGDGAEQHLSLEHVDRASTSTANLPERVDMGYDEQFVKPEGRRGDGTALLVAGVRLYAS